MTRAHRARRRGQGQGRLHAPEGRDAARARRPPPVPGMHPPPERPAAWRAAPAPARAAAGPKSMSSSRTRIRGACSRPGPARAGDGGRLAAQDSTGRRQPDSATARRHRLRSALPTSRGGRRRQHAGAAGYRRWSWIDMVRASSGNRPVLASQVDEELFSRQSQGQRSARPIPTALEAHPQAGRRVDRGRGAAGAAGAARHQHQGDRSGDRRRRRAADPEGPRQLHIRGGLPAPSSRRRDSRRPRSTGAGSPTSSGGRHSRTA